MISIHFRVKKWDYNPKAPLTNTHTDLSLITNPLKKRDTGKTEGITFTWTLVLTGEGLEILYYSSEEAILIDQKCSDTELMQIAENSYHRSYQELANRNLAVSLNAGFPEFDKVGITAKKIRGVLDM